MQLYENQLFSAILSLNLVLSVLIFMSYTRRVLFRWYRRFMGKKSPRKSQVGATLMTGAFITLAATIAGFGAPVVIEIALLTSLLTYISSSAPFFKR